MSGADSAASPVRYWLTTDIGPALRIKLEVDRDRYRAAHREAFPEEHYDDPALDNYVPDDPHWWRGSAEIQGVRNFACMDAVTARYWLLRPVLIYRGGFIEDVL